ncbi:DNA cytosine methyltransferase [Robbsia andropogonis]|uniref:DNA cytosine methyltransferase n=1 Tax=Robbsia andropogonis TaxID=28092 RepID=UPI00056AF4CF|nr:DNA cytosine methyltransferase [Robbsia andropogonis]
MTAAYYNEIDPYAAAWLRNLIEAGHIAPGEVDERSIEDVSPDDLRGFTQCHFFAGIGVWSYALRQAGWPDDQPVWTGSCPCQPFSAAGKGAGFADERHLWPAFFQLIKECRPAIVFGEQVASKDADAWIDLVHADVESLGYAFGCIPFPSAGVGAPHLRDRLYWVADANRDRCKQSYTLLLSGQQAEAGSDSPRRVPWADMERVICPDGRIRLREPGLVLLVDGDTEHLAQLRAAGNAINAEAAKVFIESVMESI